jgi:hypothetical protein
MQRPGTKIAHNNQNSRHNYIHWYLESYFTHYKCIRDHVFIPSKIHLGRTDFLELLPRWQNP